MAAVGGPIQEVSIDGRLFAVAADSDPGRDLGGFTNEVSPNGNGTARILKKRNPWLVKGLSLEVDDNRGDQEFFQEQAAKTDFVDITVTYASGFTYNGKGIIADEYTYSPAKATCEVSLSGPDKLTAQ